MGQFGKQNLRLHMNTEIISTLTAAEQLKSEWRDLAGLHPFHSPEWCVSWFKHCAGVGNLCLISERDDDGQLVGLAPFIRDITPLHTRIRFLGCGQACTDYTSIFVKDDGEAIHARICDALDKIIRQRPKCSSIRVELEGLDCGTAWYASFRRQMELRQYTIRENAIDAAYRISIPETFEHLLSRFGKSFTRKIKNIRKRYQAGELQFHRTSGSAELEMMFDDLERLHQLRRRTLGQPGVFARSGFSCFLRDAAAQLAERGQAEIQWCVLGGKIIAIQLVFLHDSTHSIYLTGMDPKHIDDQPGFSMVTGSIQDAIERKATCYDFLRGAEPYKQLWKAEPYPLHRVFLTPNAVVPLIYDSAYAFAGNVKHFAQNLWAP